MKKLIFALLLLASNAFAQAYPNLLTGQTPRSFSTPAGWTVTATENFENGTCNTGAWCSGIFNSLQFHNDGNPSDTHSLGCTYGNYSAGSLPCNSAVNWNKFLPVGTGQVYVSWYEYIDSSFRMNDEMFLARLHWDTGNGQPAFREAILDYFQNSTGQYNSTNATLLWNIQGQPYYQNRLPTNQRGDLTNFTITTGSFVQWELYMKFSTVSGTLSAGSVTFNATSHTYTRASGSWIADGVTVGSSPHFSGFTNSWNNGLGAQGGGGDSYFVTAVTDTVMTVTADCCNSTTNETATVTYQYDRGDGAYALYKNGALVAFQNNMVSPGKYDFAASNTTLSIGESYSKLIWHQPVNGTCEVQAPFTGVCATSIGNGGCGYDNLAGVNAVTTFDWNGSGLTRSPTRSSPFNTHINCDATWGGPMPTPPVFNRYIDDLIVLTQPRSSTSPAIGQATVTASSDSSANYQTVTFPGYAKFKLGDGMLSCGASALPACTSAQGLLGYWDLKNDSLAQWNFGAADSGMFEHQWGIKNNDGSLRYDEIKEGPMPITVSESNNIRVKLTQSGAVRAFGNLSNTPDCCMTMTKTYVFYRHGGNTAGTGSSKVYTNTTINYNNGDGQAPLTTAGTSTGINYYNKIGWWHVSGETNNQTNPCPSPGSLGTFTLSPWNLIYPGTQGTTLNKNYILYAPVNANDSNAAEFLPANPCTSPASVNPGPENTAGPIQPGTVMLCNGATSTACASQSASPAIVRANFLQIEQEQQCSFMSVGTQNYFLGGLRTYCSLASQTFPANTPRSWASVGFVGDNGITSDGAAAAYVTEYKTPPTLSFATGSGGSFDATEGYYAIAASNSAAAFTANGLLHSPAFLLSSFSAPAPSTITVGNATAVLDTNYVAVKTDSTHLLIQVLADVPASTQINITGVGGSITISPKSATIPVLGSVQFSAAGATFSKDGSCTSSIDATTGQFTASSTPETCTITATSGGLTDFATVTTQALTISPTSVSMNVGGTQSFTTNFPSTFTANGGTINSTSGAYTAPAVNGTYAITATALNGGTQTTASATVTGQLTLIPLSTTPISWNTTTSPSTPVSQVFTVSNSGTGAVTPTVGLTGTGFSITANTCSGPISGGGNCTVTVQFSAATIQFYSGTLLITDSAGGSQSIPLGVNIPNTAPFHIDPTNSTIPINTTEQLTATQPAYLFTDFGTIDNGGLFSAPGTSGTATVTATQQTIIAADENLQPASIWNNCGNCGNTGGTSGSPHGTFTITPGDPETFSIVPAQGFDNFFWWIVLGTPGQFNSTLDFTLSFDMQFPTQADKNASQAIEFELQKNVLDHQYSMAWQICFACGNKLRVFNKTAHAWEDSGVTVNPADFAGGKWVAIQTVYELTTGVNTRHVSIAINGVNHVVNIDHAPTPAVESDYLHPAFQMDSNSSGAPYKVLVRRFTIGSQTATTATATVNVTSVVPNTISPKLATIPTLGTQQFTATSSSTWTKSCGTLSATTGTTVTWTAPSTAQSCTVTATNGTGGADTATVTVVAPAITPSSVTMQANSTQQFTANVPVTWSISAGTCTVSSNGLVTSPSSTTTCTVRAAAQNGGTTATASVSVVGVPPSTSGSKGKGIKIRGGKIH